MDGSPGLGDGLSGVFARVRRRGTPKAGGRANIWSGDFVPPWQWRQCGEANDKDCNDFDTQRDAQAFFERRQPGDPHNLDDNGDAEACETLP